MEIRQAIAYTQLLKDKINEVLGETGICRRTGRLANFSDMFFSEQFLSRGLAVLRAKAWSC